MTRRIERKAVYSAAVRWLARMCKIAIVAVAGLLIVGCGSTKTSVVARPPATAQEHTTLSSPTGGAVTTRSTIKAQGSPNYVAPSRSAPALSGTVQIAYRDITISPDAVRVRIGSLIRWTNYDAEKCNVKSEGGAYTFESRVLREGESFELSVGHLGVIHYECTYYPVTMNGTIEVVR
jgi:plastocyanin